MSDTAPDLSGQLLAELHLAAAEPRVHTSLHTWLQAPLNGCTAGAVREAATVLGELVANAFRHAVPPYRIRVTSAWSGHQLRLSVTDGTPADEWREWRLGRGLRVVRGICPQWGVEPDQVGGGKTVWARLPVLVPPSTAR